MVDVKKLAGSFIVLAVLASLLGLAFPVTPYYLQHAAPRIAQNKNATALPQFAFLDKVENMPIALRPNLSGAKNNLTAVAMDHLSEVIAALNPAGATAVDGDPSLVLPSTDVLAAYMLMSTADESAFKVSSLWSSPEATDVAILPTADTAQNKAYTQAFKQTLKDTISAPSFIRDINQKANDGDAFSAAVVATFSDAIRKLKGVSVPAPFAAFHKNFIVYLEDQRNVVATLARHNEDPLRTMVLVGSQDMVTQRFSDDFAAVTKEYNALDLPSLLALNGRAPQSTAPLGILDHVRSFFFPVAYAFTLPGTSDLAGPNPDDKCSQGVTDSLGGALGSLTSLFSFDVPVQDKPIEQNAAGLLETTMFKCHDEISADLMAEKLSTLSSGAVTADLQGNGTLSGDPRVIPDPADYKRAAGDRGAANSFDDLLSEMCSDFPNYVKDWVYNPDSATAGKTAPANGAPATNDTVVADTSQPLGGLGSGLGLTGTGLGGLGFGAGGVLGTGGGCDTANQISPTDFYSADAAQNDPDYLTHYFGYSEADNLFTTLGAAQENISQGATDAAQGAQNSFIAGGGVPADVKCVKSRVNSDGTILCEQQVTQTPPSLISAMANTAATSQYTMLASSKSMAGLDQKLADSLGSQLLRNPQAGLRSITFQVGASLGNICQKLLIPGAGGLPNPAFAFCQTTVGKIIQQYTKYLNIINNITSLIGKFF